eukprot:TRINITY_DN3322_c0_g1_i1.p2 TRINITY_DN3322_c0_g1~~TRINITY_DN3322_c0_g1_i1.p2  ORF type:complete len:141 (+),score=7.71 TRINITY_DN3322_c0_g1_i1:2-424(+)
MNTLLYGLSIFIYHIDCQGSYLFFFLIIRRPPRSTLSSSSAASDVYKRQVSTQSTWDSTMEKVQQLVHEKREKYCTFSKILNGFKFDACTFILAWQAELNFHNFEQTKQKPYYHEMYNFTHYRTDFACVFNIAQCSGQEC